MPTAPDSPELIRPAKRSGRMSELAAVEEVPVWLEVNGRPVVTWMCTPDLLEELAVGWLHGEGYIDRLEEVHLRPCATDLGFWAEVPAARVDAVQAEGRRPVLASGCGAVSTFLAEPGTVEARPPRGAPPGLEQLRALFKALFARGDRYKDTGGIHAAALVDQAALPGSGDRAARPRGGHRPPQRGGQGHRRRAAGGAAGGGARPPGHRAHLGRAGLQGGAGGDGWVATPSVPSTLAVEIARRSGMVLVGRAVSGSPQRHGAGLPDAG